MVRNYIPKTVKTPESELRKAIELVRNRGYSVRSAAQFVGCHRDRLRRYMKIHQINVKEIKARGKIPQRVEEEEEEEDQENKGQPVTLTVAKHRRTQVFNSDQENQFCAYILKPGNDFFGITPRDVRKLAFQWATQWQVTMPRSWQANKMAGPDWMKSFFKRHPELCARSHEQRLLARGTAFKRVKVEKFFDSLAKAIGEHNINMSNIWNVDEIAVTTTLQKPGETSETALAANLITMCIAVNAIGSSTPPMLIFPCENFQDRFVQDGPAGCIGTANASGRMTEDDFLKFLGHFTQFANHPRAGKKVLLLLDDHESHHSVRVLGFAKENDIVLLSFPPRCSHRLQPLERTVHGSLKMLLHRARDSWVRNNRGKTMTVYDLPAILRDALPRAITSSNVLSGFAETGISPFRRDVFGDADYNRSDPKPSTSKHRASRHFIPGGDLDLETWNSLWRAVFPEQQDDGNLHAAMPRSEAIVPTMTTTGNAHQSDTCKPKGSRGSKKGQTGISATQTRKATKRKKS